MIAFFIISIETRRPSTGLALVTLLSAIPLLTSPDSIAAAGSILCIDRQHAAVLRFVLGEYPIPETFGSTEMAYSG